MEITSRELQKETGRLIDEALSKPVTIMRHNRPVAVLVSHDEWERLTFADPRWRAILDKLAQVWNSRKTDHELLCDLLLQWEINQQSGNGKSDLLFALLYIAMKESGVDADEAKSGAVFVRNEWKG